MEVPARAYDRQLPLERAALAAAADLVDVQQDDRLLDVATGTGGLLRELVRRDARAAEVVGIDRSDSVLAFAAARLPAQWRTVSGDARELPFDDMHFDAVTACYLLHLLDAAQRAAVLGEMARVLRPGGRALTVTMQSRRSATRAALCLPPRSWGLRPLDPSDELAAAGLAPQRAQFVHRGWPSLCVLAVRA